MPISLNGVTTAAVTTTSGLLSAHTTTFLTGNANDLRTKVFDVSAVAGATGATIHSATNPKQFMIKRPANYLLPSGLNTVSGQFSKVPYNVTRVIGRGSCKIAANQVAALPISMDISVPAGASYDAVNLEHSICMFIAALWDQKEEIIQAVQDGRF